MTARILQQSVTVRVPATSANLGPGFDCLGLALALYDEVVVTAGDPADGDHVDVAVQGEGAGSLPADAQHLVVRAVHAALDAMHAAHPPLSLSCTNRIPHGRGLGSSAAAVCAGLLAGRALVADGTTRLDDDAVLSSASGLEGHPDNAAACLLGGLTVAWSDDDMPGGVHAVRLEPGPDLRTTVLVPTGQLSTETARRMLPSTVPHNDAAHTAGRAALLVAALTGVPGRPDLLLPATDDRLHQRYRATAMPETDDLVGSLRAAGRAAVVSGAGPSVLVLTEGESAPVVAPAGWTALELDVDRTGAMVMVH
jgi:homoserine kinase